MVALTILRGADSIADFDMTPDQCISAEQALQSRVSHLVGKVGQRQQY